MALAPKHHHNRRHPAPDDRRPPGSNFGINVGFGQPTNNSNINITSNATIGSLGNPFDVGILGTNNGGTGNVDVHQTGGTIFFSGGTNSMELRR